MSCAATDAVFANPVIVTAKFCLINFDCELLAVRAGVDESVAVHTTVYNPTVFGVKVGFCVVALLNSFVVIEPLGPIVDQLKE